MVDQIRSNKPGKKAVAKQGNVATIWQSIATARPAKPGWHHMLSHAFVKIYKIILNYSIHNCRNIARGWFYIFIS